MNGDNADVEHRTDVVTKLPETYKYQSQGNGCAFVMVTLILFIIVIK